MSTDKISVRVENFIKHYGKLVALEGVSFSASAGQAIALWGPNGAGKTTLLKAMLGLIDFKGKLEIEGCDVRRAGKQARRKIGYVPQEASFYDLSVQETMDFYARLKKVGAKSILARHVRVSSLIKRVGLRDHANKPVPALSGGLKQRLALAIALLADPPVLLLDEPTANLDAKARSDYLSLLASLHHEGKTIIFASHRIEEVETLADHVLILENGKLSETISPEELRARLSSNIEMVLWIDKAQRAFAQTFLVEKGIDSHLNGRGTVVVRIQSQQKMRALNLLNECGVIVQNFEIESNAA
ncbi:MAG: ABC transporter ATP-binding protein [Chloroflexi bacterium]|nr:ABC transporter ATP-binding protein [Chloroflexota bacterium]